MEKNKILTNKNKQQVKVNKTTFFTYKVYFKVDSIGNISKLFVICSCI